MDKKIYISTSLSKQLGKLPPRYHFFLNPYQDVRFTRCPRCDISKMKRALQQPCPRQSIANMLHCRQE